MSKEKRMFRLIYPQEGGHLIVKKIGRNSPCPCGSGKKVKHCCNKTATYYSSKPKDKNN
jgi:uncharacterized protein YecA (UPF0149 family)